MRTQFFVSLFFFRIQKVCVCLFFCLAFHISYAQHNPNYYLQIVSDKKHDIRVLNKKQYETEFADSIALIDELSRLQKHLQHKGYLACSFDSLVFDSLFVKAYLHTGRQYRWHDLSAERVPVKKMEKQQNRFIRQMDKKPVNRHRIADFEQKQLREFSHSGYPFAQTGLDSVRIVADKISANLYAEPNQQIVIDTIHVKCHNCDVRQTFIQRYLTIKPGDVYDESKIERISSQVQSLPYLKEIRPFDVVFHQETADLYLYLTQRKANRFNGILGLQPSDKTKSKVMLTGELNLLLHNKLGRGERIRFDWSHKKSASQDLALGFTYPFLFNLPVGVDVSFALEKTDSTYLTVDYSIGLPLLFSGTNYLKAYFRKKTSSKIGGQSETENEENIGNISASMYGLMYRYEQVDYRFNPRKGVIFEGNASLGTKTQFQAENTTQYEFHVTADAFFPLFSRSTIHFANQTAWLYNSEKRLYENELFKIGGLNSFRGIDEKSVLASLYSIGTVEYRFLFEENAHFLFFYEIMYYQKHLTERILDDLPYSFGIGASFDTRAGIFSLHYGIGKQFDNPIDLQSAKVHVGYISRF